MGYETSAFGGPSNVTDEVSQHFGQRDTGNTRGVKKTEGAKNQAVVTFDGTEASDGAFSTKTALKIPAGAVIKEAYLEVSEVFVIGGTSATILIGTDGSEVTNGLVISEAQAEAAATYDLTSTLTGTWAAPLAADATVGIALGGTSPTSTAAGKAKLVVEYVEVGAV